MEGLRYALVALTTCGLMGCSGTGGKPGEQPSWRRGDGGGSGQPTKRLVFAPQTPQVASYNDGAERRMELSALADAVAAAARRAADSVGLPTPLPEARLFRVAEELARVAPQDAPLPYRMVEFAMFSNGIIEPSPDVMVVWGPEHDDPQDIARELEARLPASLREGGFSRLGVGRAIRGNGQACTVVAMHASHLSTDPIPRHVEVGEVVKLRGSVKPPFAEPKLYVTRQAGVESPALTTDAAGQFQADVECRSRGVLQLEIMAADDGGARVLANFPVYCGGIPPTQVVIEPSSDDSRPVTNESEAESRMADLVNRDRKAAGLPPLEGHKVLSRVARAHSKEMRDTRRVAHVSPITGSAFDRVKAAGQRTSVVMENVARAYGVEEAQSGLMNSPGHRANLLSNEVSHIGIGIVFGEEVAGRREMFVTQVFGKPPADLSPEQAKKRVLGRMRVIRPVDEDPRLTSVASRFAADMAAGKTADQAGATAAARMRQLNLRYASVTTIVSATIDVDAFDVADTMSDPRTRYAGIGVAVGRHKTLGDGAYFIVVLVAQR